MPRTSLDHRDSLKEKQNCEAHHKLHDFITATGNNNNIPVKMTGKQKSNYTRQEKFGLPLEVYISKLIE